MADGLQQVGLARALGIGHQTRFSDPVTHSRLLSARWVAEEIEERDSIQDSKVLPAGKCARRLLFSMPERSRPSTSATNRTRSASAGSQRWARAVGRHRGSALART